jgi:hypothetical protein
MARAKKVVTENQRRSIVSQYAKDIGLKEISNNVGHSVGVIRRVLVENGATIRLRGRPCLAEA